MVTLSGGLEIALIIVGIIVLLIIIVVAWYVSILNTMRRLVVKIDESESSIDVALTKRYDLLTKLFQTVKGYMKHERETLEKVIAMRQPGSQASIGEKQEFANEVSKGLQAINVVVEQYPDLKANQNMLNLQNQTAEVEENLQAARRVYNSNVSYYNQYIAVFPNNIVSRRRNFTKREFFEADEAKRQDVKFDF